MHAQGKNNRNKEGDRKKEIKIVCDRERKREKSSFSTKYPAHLTHKKGHKTLLGRQIDLNGSITDCSQKHYRYCNICFRRYLIGFFV